MAWRSAVGLKCRALDSTGGIGGKGGLGGWVRLARVGLDRLGGLADSGGLSGLGRLGRISGRSCMLSCGLSCGLSYGLRCGLSWGISLGISLGLWARRARLWARYDQWSLLAVSLDSADGPSGLGGLG